MSTKSKSLFKLIFIIMFFVMTCVGITFMRLGMNYPLEISFAPIFLMSLGWVSLIGYATYIISFFMFTKLVTMFPVSYIFPFTQGINQILILIISLTILGEQVSSVSFAGIAMVIAGIVVMNLPQGKSDEKEVVANG